MSTIQMIRCLAGKHSRSRKHARVGPDGHLRSHCVHCGRPLVRVFSRDGRDWRVDKGDSSASAFRFDDDGPEYRPDEHLHE